MAEKPSVLLVNPHWTGIGRQKQRQFRRVWPPLCLALAAAMLEREGFSVEILDNNALGLPLTEVAQKASSFDKVFVTSTPYDRWQCPSISIGFFLETARAVAPEKLVILGGHVTERPETLLRATGARAAILSEPEESILAVAERDDPAAGRDTRPDIPGLAFLSDGRLVRTAPREPIADLDSLPFPAFHLLPMERYHYFPVMGRGFAILEASRGCPARCTFCYLGMYGKKLRRKSVPRFLDEVEAVVSRHRLRNLYFMDLEFALDRAWVLAFCKGMTERGILVNWCCHTRVTDMDGEVAAAMRKAGCSLIHFGVEAGNAEILASTRKGITAAKAVESVRVCRSHGIRTAVFMNFGFPGETEAQMEETIDLARAMNPTYASFHLIVPFPGTPLAEKLSVDPEAFPADQYPSYNFVDQDLSSLKRMLHRAYRRFYLRPGWALGFLSDHVKIARSPTP